MEKAAIGLFDILKFKKNIEVHFKIPNSHAIEDYKILLTNKHNKNLPFTIEKRNLRLQESIYILKIHKANNFELNFLYNDAPITLWTNDLCPLNYKSGMDYYNIGKTFFWYHQHKLYMSKSLKDIYKMLTMHRLHMKDKYNIDTFYEWRKYHKKDILLFMDGEDYAGDNGETFCEFCMNKQSKYKCFFAISFSKTKPEELERLKNKFHLIDLDDPDFETYILKSKYVFSSVFRYQYYCLDKLKNTRQHLLKTKFIFLPHGVTKTIFATPWLDYYNAKFKGIVVSNEIEKKSFDDINNYSYPFKVTIPTCLPRFDKLKNKGEEYVLLMPSWRKTIETESDFIQSDFFKQWTALINSQELKNEEIHLILHPKFAKFLQIINSEISNENIKIFQPSDISYSKEINYCKYAITDFSSVGVDVSYANKPMLYFEFEENHHGKSLFEVGVDFPGESFKTVDEFSTIIKNGFDENKQNSDNFFFFKDENNCKRLYDTIFPFFKVGKPK